MLLVKTKIAKSSIHGIGVFADQPIKKGTVIWKFMPEFDISFSKQEVEKLSNPAKEQFYHYAYFDKKYGKYVLCSDDARFLIIRKILIAKIKIKRTTLLPRCVI